VYSFVKSVQVQVLQGNVKGGVAGLESRQFAERAEKKKKAEADALMAFLFKSMQNL
jgi:hypothetical protein